MNLSDLIKNKLKDDIKEELLKEYHKDNLLSTNYSYDTYKEIIDDKLNSKIKNIDFSDKKIKRENNSSCCCARVWNNNRGTQCTYTKKNGDYCIHHKKQIENKGYLSFKRYDETRPLYNEKGNKIPWYNHTHYEMLEIIIKYQNLQLVNLIN